MGIPTAILDRSGSRLCVAAFGIMWAQRRGGPAILVTQDLGHAAKKMMQRSDSWNGALWNVAVERIDLTAL